MEAEILNLIAEERGIVAALLLLLLAILRERYRSPLITESECAKRCGAVKERLHKLEPDPSDSRGTISHYERASREPKLPKVLALVALLGDADYLFGLADAPGHLGERRAS